jgi:hypothetical protein
MRGFAESLARTYAPTMLGDNASDGLAPINGADSPRAARVVAAQFPIQHVTVLSNTSLSDSQELAPNAANCRP